MLNGKLCPPWEPISCHQPPSLRCYHEPRRRRFKPMHLITIGHHHEPSHLVLRIGSRHAHHTGEESEVLAAPEPLSSLPMAVIYRDVWRRHERSEMWRLTPTTTTVETRAREIVITHMLASPSLLTSNHHPLRFPPAMLLPFCVSILCPWWLRT